MSKSKKRVTVAAAWRSREKGIWQGGKVDTGLMCTGCFLCNQRKEGGYFFLSAVRSSRSEFSMGMTGLAE